MRNVAETETIILEQLVYTWAERTLTGTGNGVVLRSHGWPTGNSIAADAALADFVEYLPAKLQYRLGSGRTPPLGADFWCHRDYGNVVAVHRYLGVDSAGRGGRSLVHVFLDKECRLDAQAALELCQSPLVATDWDLKAEPVNAAEGLRFLPDHHIGFAGQHDRNLLTVGLTGILEYLIHDRKIVFTHDRDIDSLGLLAACLGILPHALAGKITFSTFRGIPQRSNCAISFASTIFSEVLPKADVEKSYVRLDAAVAGGGGRPEEGDTPLENFSAEAIDLATGLLSLQQAGGPKTPADIDSVYALEQWLRHHGLALRPVESLQLAECEALLALPAQTSWLQRGPIIDRAAGLTERDTGASASLPAFLGLLAAEEREAFGRRLHSTAVAELVSSPDRSLAVKHRAEALGYPVQRLAELAVPVLDSLPADERPLDPALRQFVAEIARFIPLQQRIDWASRSGFQDPLLGQWQSTAAAIVERTWTEPEWAAAHSAAARAVAIRHPSSSADVLAAALSGYQSSPRVIDAVLALDDLSGDMAFTEVVRNVVSLPGLRVHQLQRLAACHRLPSDMRAEISAIIHPPVQRIAPVAAHVVEPATAQPAVVPLMESSAQDPAWPQAGQELTLTPGFTPSLDLQPDVRTQKPETVRRRTLVRMLAVVLSALAGYLIASTDWSLLAWPPALLVVLISLVLMALPLKRQPGPVRRRRWPLLSSPVKRMRTRFNTGRRSSRRTRKPSA